MNKPTERTIYAAGIITASLSIIFEYNWILCILLIILSLGYMATGWILLHPQRIIKFDLLYFFAGYVYSTTFVALFFVNRNYPLTSTLKTVSFYLLIILIILFLIIERDRKKPVLENVIKAGLLLIVIYISRFF